MAARGEEEQQRCGEEGNRGGGLVTKQAAAAEEAAGYPRRAILMRSRGLPRPVAVNGDIKGEGGVIFALVARRSVVSKGRLDSPTRRRGMTPP